MSASIFLRFETFFDAFGLNISFLGLLLFVIGEAGGLNAKLSSSRDLDLDRIDRVCRGEGGSNELIDTFISEEKLGDRGTIWLEAEGELDIDVEASDGKVKVVESALSLPVGSCWY